MLFLSDMLLNHPMKSISEIRLENLKALVEQAGTAERLAELAGLSPIYISQIRGRAIDAKTGKPRNLGSVAARKLEVGMNKARGWMDKDHAAGPDDLGPKWPFKRINPDDYDRLSAAQKEAIEDWVEGQLRSFLSSAHVKRDEERKASA